MPQNLYIKPALILETGIAIIDEQHRGVITIINSLYYLMSQNLGSVAIEPTRKVLSAYTDIHFKTEEYLLEQHGWEGLEDHKKYHTKLLEKMAMSSTASKQQLDAQPLLEFLKDWWIAHINQIDRVYVEWFNQRLQLPSDQVTKRASELIKNRE